MPDTDLEGFVNWLRESGYREATIRAYRKTLARALKHEDPTAEIRAGKLSKPLRLQTISALKLWANHIGGGAGDEILDSLRSLPKQRFRDKPPERPLTDDEWRRLVDSLEVVDEPLRAVLGLLCATGLRVGDIGHIDREKAEEAVETGVLYLEQKGGRHRPYPAKAIEDNLNSLLEWQGWTVLWQVVTAKSEEAYYMAVTRALRRAAKAAGLDPKKIHPHLLRRTVATQLLRTTGGNIVAVQKLLGHADITTTQGYVDYVDVDELEEWVGKMNQNRGDDA